MAGTVLAVILYKLIKALEYESANKDPELGPVPPAASESAQGERTHVGQQREMEQRDVAIRGDTV
jgi:hypothetical protein